MVQGGEGRYRGAVPGSFGPGHLVVETGGGVWAWVGRVVWCGVVWGGPEIALEMPRVCLLACLPAGLPDVVSGLVQCRIYAGSTPDLCRIYVVSGLAWPRLAWPDPCWIYAGSMPDLCRIWPGPA